jgi:uncharacterized membrane protein (DUF485 family)
MADSQSIRLIARRRNVVALVLTGLMVVSYFTFMVLFAFFKDILAQDIADGLTVCMVAGPLVIIIGCLLSGVYVLWANIFYDPLVKDLIPGRTE